jgi:large subunit ribosomal protein L7/L12
MANLDKIVEDLSALTVLEAAELAKLLEEKWGVSAAAPVAVAAAGGGAPAAAAEAAAKGSSEGSQATSATAGIPAAEKGVQSASKLAGSKLVKGAGVLGNIATMAEPALESFKYFRNPELLDKKIEEVANLQERGLGTTVGKTVLDVTPVPAQAFNPNYSPVGTLAATIGSPFEQTRRLREAEGELAASQTQQQFSEKRGAEMQKLRQEMFPESTRENTTREEFASQMDKVREAYQKLRTQRK